MAYSRSHGFGDGSRKKPWKGNRPTADLFDFHIHSQWEGRLYDIAKVRDTMLELPMVSFDMAGRMNEGRMGRMGRSEDLYRLDYSVVGVMLALFLAKVADVVRFLDFTVYGVTFVFEATIYAVLATCILLFTRVPNRHLLVTSVSAVLVLFSLLAAIRALVAPWAVLSLDFGNADLKGVPMKVAPSLATRMLAARVIISASVEAIFVAFFVKKLSLSIRRRREKSQHTRVSL